MEGVLANVHAPSISGQWIALNALLPVGYMVETATSPRISGSWGQVGE